MITDNLKAFGKIFVPKFSFYREQGYTIFAAMGIAFQEANDVFVLSDDEVQILRILIKNNKLEKIA